MYSAYRWNMINLNLYNLRILSTADGVTCVSRRFGRFTVIRLHMTHAHISWRLLPRPPNAGLSLLRSAIDSGTILWAISQTVALWIVRFLATARDTSLWRDTRYKKRCYRGVSKRFALPCSTTVCWHCVAVWTSHTHTHTQTHTDPLHRKPPGSRGLRRLVTDVCANIAGYWSGNRFYGRLLRILSGQSAILKRFVVFLCSKRQIMRWSTR